MPEPSLQVHRSRLAGLWWLPVALVVLAGVGWWLTHPEALADDGGSVRAEATANAPVYVGVWAPSSDDPTVTVTGVRLEVDQGTAEAALCHGGRIGVTSDPQAFCEEVTPLEHHEVGPGDQVILAVRGPAGSTVRVEPVTLSYRDGMRSGSQAVGPRVQVDVAG